MSGLTRVGKGRVIFTFLLFLQCFIVLTGGIVRITGSGLGCPTWPECAPGSFTPSPYQAESPLHAWIEFANRLLTFLLGFVALAAVIYAIAFIPLKRVRALAGLQLLGIIAQAILGGITVLTGLHPSTVVAHLLVSILLIAGALSLRQRVYGAIPGASQPTLLTARLLKALVTVGFTVVVMGSIVTGTGPHSGDSDSSRFSFDLRTVAWLHADIVIFFIGLLIATLIAIQLGETGATRTALLQKIYWVIALSLGQGAIGYLQWFTGVPEFLVAFHLIGAVSVWLSLWNLYITGSVTSSPSGSKGAQYRVE